ncbi:MAG TPA: hypothetical protein VNU84_05860 [Candidatus Acidoferrum sp.]|nr:hypothetical protein [Candidatus Acidoferrum sp.]
MSPTEPVLAGSVAADEAGVAAFWVSAVLMLRLWVAGNGPEATTEVVEQL